MPLPENLRAFIEDPEGASSYPIVTYTWMLVPKKVADPNKAKAIEAMVEYGLTEGQKVSSELGYVPLPQSVKRKSGCGGRRHQPRLPRLRLANSNC